MFKRRNPRSPWRIFKEFFYPHAGWKRTIEYMAHRLKRLPDTPHRIALGFACGVFVCFTPFFGLHIFLAIFLAYIIRGNILATLCGTFFGNPLTFPIIATVSYRFGLWIFGDHYPEPVLHRIQSGVSNSFETIWLHVKSIFGYKIDNLDGWGGLVDFFDEIMWPYFIGGLLPGILTAISIYFFSKPLIGVYQKRRKGRILARIKNIRVKKPKDTDIS